MSRFLKVMITLLVIAGFVAPAVAMAEDRLSLSGYYTVRGFMKDNADYNDNADDSQEYFYQRLRMGGNLAVAEGVSVKFRADIAEGNLGVFAANADAQNRGNIEFDQAYVVIDKEMFTLSTGQFGVGFGNAMLLDRTDDFSTVLTLKDINLTLAYIKAAEGDLVAADDTDVYAAIYGIKNDMMSMDIFAGYLVEHGTDHDRLALGVAGAVNLDAAKIAYEVNYIDGEEANGDDAKGLQMYLNGSMGFGEAVTAGAIFTYAAGQDGANEVQAVDLAANDFSPENWGFMGTLYTVYSATGADTFDPAGQNTGVIALQPYVDFKVSDDIALHAHVAYAEPEDDATNYDSFLTFAGSARYAFAANTNFDVALSHSTPDAKTGYSDDANTTYACRLTVSF
jgi:hypothetical protein